MKHSYYPAILLAVCLGAFTPLEAQYKENIRFERFTIEQGISSDRVFCVTQDPQGYIWAGTEAGLSRYDGYGFTVFRNIPGDSSSLADNVVNAVLYDRTGTLWVGTQNGLSRYDFITGTFSNTNPAGGNENSLPGKVVRTIHESKTGELWFGTDNGLARYDRNSDRYTSRWLADGKETTLAGTTVTSIAEDGAGTLWIGTSSRGLVNLDPKTNKILFYNELEIPGVNFPTANISKVMVSSAGEIWLGFLPRNGLGRFNPVTRTFRLYVRDPVKHPDFWNFISDILETADHTIWVCTFLGGGVDSGIHRYDAQTDRFTRYTNDPDNPSSLSWGYTQALFEDRFNNLWVATSRGLNKADLKRWQMGIMNVNAKDPNNLVNNYYAIEEVDDNIFWLGLDGEGFIEWDRNTGARKYFAIPDYTEMEGIHALQKDIDGLIWVGFAGNGLSRENRKTGKKEAFKHQPGNPASLAGNFVTDLLLDSKKNLWIATSHGLSRYNRERNDFTSWTRETSPGMSGNSLSSLFEDKNGLIWIGTKEHVYDPSLTVSSGLMRFDPATGAFTCFRHDHGDASSLSSDVVRCIAEDPGGTIWVGTNNGLNRLNQASSTFEVFLPSSGLPDPNVMGIQFDEQGKMWLSTLKGISRFDPVSKVFRNFTLEDGIQANRYNENSFYKTRSGELIFGGIMGANWFLPSSVSADEVIPEIHITRLLKFNEPVQLGKPSDETKNIRLKWNDNSVGFEYVAVNFRSALQTRYEYRLDGFDREWVRAGTRRYVNYTNLRPGAYTFRVRAINSEGVQSLRDAVITVSISPPFWRTWYAYLFYALVVIGAVIIVDRYQRKRLLSKVRERNRDRELAQAREIEKAYTELKATQTQLVHAEKMASLGELTAGIAHEIQNPLNFVNNFSELSTELLDELDEELRNGNPSAVPEISGGIRENLQKISHHGKRADSIVKGMLQHSRTGSGTKEPADFNSLVDEYLRLSYHGLRARDKSFNAAMITGFDPAIGRIRIIPQDMGRVVLNLFTNSFYALNEKRKLGLPGWEPSVSVSTKLTGSMVELRIRDNGTGIPARALGKIFQPFFTTKPTGEGTGLGLSLSYDIITRGHGGELTVETEEGEFTEFTIRIPV